MNRDIKKIISQMSLEEKADLCSGEGTWNTKAIPEHDIPSIMMTDGPHGLRKQSGHGDHMGMNQSVPATCFPTAAGLACSWNRDLIEKVGTALGEECQAENVQIILGPGANIKRSPLCGRNFEYYSEDPYLSSQLATRHIKAVQNQGIGTSMKHFAVNNQETRRFNIDAVLDERTFREIYLASFEAAVKDAQPWTVMSAYNKINGSYCSENKYLLTDILRDDWGFEGSVVSDWGGVSERDDALLAGLDLEMPTSSGIGREKVINAVKSGKLSEEALDKSVERLLTIIFKAVDSRKENATYDKDRHHQIAKEVALESMVLLKNEEKILPLENKGKIALIGAFVKNPRYQGAGSSRINPTRIDNPYDEIVKIADNAEILHAEGYSLSSCEIDEDMINEATEAAGKSDVTVIFAGLPDNYDSEGCDRKHMRLPDNQNALIEAVAEVKDNIIVVLFNGSALEMPWLHKVKGVLEAYLGGQAMASALADILFGNANPSGKLAETFPMKLSQNPSFINFPGESDKVEYREGLFVGYRYYDKVELEPMFPFGYGLSYTNFEYSNLTLDKKVMLDSDQVTVSVNIKNTGNREGKEIVQLYVSDIESSVIRPIKELKGFEKVALQPGEEKLVTFKLNRRSFAYYHVGLKDWYVESGDFEIMIGKSSHDIVLMDTVNVKSTVKVKNNFTLDSTLLDIMDEPAAQQMVSIFTSRTNEDSLKSMGLDIKSVLSSVKMRALVAITRGAYDEEKLKAIVKEMNND